jgi:hypothetical protein
MSWLALLLMFLCGFVAGQAITLHIILREERR